MIPRELKVATGRIELNAGRRIVTHAVANTGDCPFVFAHIKAWPGLDTIIRFIETEGRLVH